MAKRNTNVSVNAKGVDCSTFNEEVRQDSKLNIVINDRAFFIIF